MKYAKRAIIMCSAILLSLSLVSCVSHDSKDQQNELKTSSADNAANAGSAEQFKKPDLPTVYQAPSFVVDKGVDSDIATTDDIQVKIGARISSKNGAQPLWYILKRIATLKDMSVSWAKDVDQNALVDVDINAKDNLSDAVNKLLSQIGYFAEIDGSTIYVINKTTKQYQIAMPFISQEYSTDTGGDIISGNDKKNGMKALISLKAKGSPVGTASLDDSGSRKADFDAWANIESNLKVILDILEASEVTTSSAEREYGIQENMKVAADYQGDYNQGDTASGKNAKLKEAASGNRNIRGSGSAADKNERQKVKTSRQVARDGSYFIIDKPVGIITVTTSRELHKKIENYINSLKNSIYKQISIEAKIIEVQLSDASSIGINWSSVLKNFNLNGIVQFGADGQVYPFIYSNDDVVGDVTYTDATKASYFKSINPGQFVSNITMNSAAFSVFLNALNEQGDTKILSNPKISVLNGQPAFITVGRTSKYIDNVEAEIDQYGNVAYTVETADILSGVGMALTATVHGENEIIMNLVPITSQLEEPIEYKDFGTSGGTVGLPVVNIREMNTTVRVRNGEMLVIGGLISDTNKTTGEFAPILGDIPLVRYLFGYEEKQHIKRELIILLRPQII